MRDFNSADGVFHSTVSIPQSNKVSGKVRQSVDTNEMNHFNSFIKESP